MDRKARLGGLRSLGALLSGQISDRKSTDAQPETETEPQQSAPASIDVSPGTPATVASLTEDQAPPLDLNSQDANDHNSPHLSEASSIAIQPPSPSNLQQAGQPPLVASLTTVDGDVIFHEVFDIW